MAALTRMRAPDDAPTATDHPPRATYIEIQALIAEARRRRNVRLLRLAGLALCAVVALVIGLTWPQSSAGRHHAGAASGGGVAATRSGGSPLLVWASYDGDVVIGNLRTLSTHVVAGADVDFSSPLVPSGGFVYWIKQSGGFIDGASWPRVVEALDPTTGRSVDVAPGEYLFKSATGAGVYAALTDTSLTELPSGASRPGNLTLPHGWFLPGGEGNAVAKGIIVQSNDSPAIVRRAELAVWNPATGGVRPIGRGEGAIAAFTPRGAHFSLLAWMPASCRIPSCPIAITNTVTLASRTVHSRLGHGFVLGGAFSPAGRRLAVFANLSADGAAAKAELAIVGTATGAGGAIPGVQMIPGSRRRWGRTATGSGGCRAEPA